MPWRREWLPTPVFLPGEIHGQRSLAGYSPCSLRESDTTEQITYAPSGNSKQITTLKEHFTISEVLSNNYYHMLILTTFF